MNLAALKKLLEKATPLPWLWDYAHPGWLLGGRPKKVEGGHTIPCVLDGIADANDCNVSAKEQDRELIEVAVNNLPAMIEVIEAAQKIMGAYDSIPGLTMHEAMGEFRAALAKLEEK